MSIPTAVSLKSAADTRLLRLFVAVTLPLYLLDQLTKYLVRRHITEPVDVIPGWFELVNVKNTGAAWGMFRDGNLFFIVLSVLALAVIAVLSRQAAFEAPLPSAGFTLLAAGVLGNLTDRLFHQGVIDFLSFNLHVPMADPWPSFNVADSCIFVAVCCFLWSSWREMRAEPAPSSPQP
jgi:signal peptidase II